MMSEGGVTMVRGGSDEEGFSWLMRGQRSKVEQQIKYEDPSSSLVRWRQEVQSLRETKWRGETFCLKQVS